MLSHPKLKGYGKGLAVVASLAKHSAAWDKRHAVDSALECAACLDIAVIKEFLLPEPAALEKRSLCEVVRMLIGLRRSWEKNALREEPPAFDGQPNAEPQGWYFAHEPWKCIRWG